MKLRKAKGLATKELGELVNITECGILSYENNNAYPSRPILLKLIEVLGEDVLCDDYSRFIITDYGPLIKKWRMDNKFSCEDAANFIGVSERMLYALENMEYALGRKRFEKIKDRLVEIVLIN